MVIARTTRSSSSTTAKNTALYLLAYPRIQRTSYSLSILWFFSYISIGIQKQSIDLHGSDTPIIISSSSLVILSGLGGKP
jgi:hypothetical protein